MKSFYYIIVLFVACLFAQDIAAQSPRTRRPVESNNTGLPELSVRAQAKNRDQSTDINNVIWLRILYRNIDLKQAANAPLYFPTEPIGDRMNLFTLMFKLFIEGKLTVYEYIDGREVFSDRYKIDVEKWLREHHYVYRKTGTGASATFTVDDIDIQSGDVMAYMVKEAYYFNQATGTFGTEVLAICPMRVWEGDYGEPMRTPMFWVPYENIRPYISRSFIMTSNYNNALTYTADDFFQLNMYEGEIIKTVNMMNQALAEQFPDSAKLKHAQDSIERQLRDFESRLWLQKDTAKTVTVTKSKQEPKANARNTATRSSANVSESKSNVKTATPKAPKASSSPSRSVRRR